MPEPEPVADTTDRGEPLDTKYRDLAKRIADAAESGDTKTLESLCGRCNESNRKQIGTPQGRQTIRRAMRTHPAADDRSATYPGLAVKRCVDEPRHAEACTAQQINDIGLLDLEPDSDIGEGLEDIFRAPVADSIRLEVDEQGNARWAGLSTSAEPYKVKQAEQGMPDSYFFMPPEGDYYCGILAEMAGCQGTTHPIPPRPESCGEGPSWGGGMFVDPSGKVDFLCAGVVFYWGAESEPGPEDRLAAGPYSGCGRAVSRVRDCDGEGARVSPADGDGRAGRWPPGCRPPARTAAGLPGSELPAADVPGTDSRTAGTPSAPHGAACSTDIPCGARVMWPGGGTPGRPARCAHVP